MNPVIKKILIITTLLLSVGLLRAQNDDVKIGLRMGFGFNKTHYSDDAYADYKQKIYPGIHYGITTEIPLNNTFTFNPEMLYTAKGMKISDGFDYEMLIESYNFNLPLYLHFPKSGSGANFFLMASPQLSVVQQGVITYNDYSVDLSTANIAPLNWSLSTGLGFRLPFNDYTTAYFEVNYNHGISSTFSSKETSGEAVGVNFDPYEIAGTRSNRGIEINMSFFVSPSGIIKKIRSKRAAPEPEPEPVVIEPEPEEEEEEPDTVPKIPEKDCYTIADITEYVDNEYDVTGLKICLHTITFEFNKSVLKAEAKTYLDDIVLLLNNLPDMKMKINGHTDNVGNTDYNLKLSKQRAESVYNYLISQGIDSSRLSHEGYGDTQPIDTNNTEEGRTNNRRVEFEIME